MTYDEYTLAGHRPFYYENEPRPEPPSDWHWEAVTHMKQVIFYRLMPDIKKKPCGC